MGKNTPPKREKSILKKNEKGSPFLKIKTKEAERFPMAEKEMLDNKREIKNKIRLKFFKGKEKNMEDAKIIKKILKIEFIKS